MVVSPASVMMCALVFGSEGRSEVVESALNRGAEPTFRLMNPVRQGPS